MPEGAGKAGQPVRLSDSGSFHAHTRPPAPAAPGPPLLQKGAAGPAGAGPAGGAGGPPLPSRRKARPQGRSPAAFCRPRFPEPAPVSFPGKPCPGVRIQRQLFLSLPLGFGGEFVIFLFFLQEHFFSVTMKFGKSAPGAMPRGFPQYTRNERLV